MNSAPSNVVPPDPSSYEATGPSTQDMISNAGPGSYLSPIMAEGMVFDSHYTLSSPGVSDSGVASAGSQGTGTSDGQYSSVYGSYEGDDSYRPVVAVQDENWNSRSAPSYGGENPEPVFSDVSDLEPVYSFSSRSRYQRGRAVFAQTRYTPGEPFYPPIPIARHTSKITREYSPADTPAKGGF